MVELKQKAPKAVTPKPTPHIPQTVFPPMRKNEEALIRLRVLRSRLANLKMNGKTGILQEVDAILGVLE